MNEEQLKKLMEGGKVKVRSSFGGGATGHVAKRTRDRGANKYGAVRTYSNVFDRWFASKVECQRGEHLRLLELAGEISELKCQPLVRLTPHRKWHLDFSYVQGGRMIWEDVKGKPTRKDQGFRNNVNLWRDYGPGLLLLVEKRGARWAVDEVEGGGK
jgi:hypothetical protein